MIKQIKKVYLTHFNFKNTYSYNLIRKKIKNLEIIKLVFIEDKYNGTKINNEYLKYKKNIPGVGKVC